MAGRAVRKPQRKGQAVSTAWGESSKNLIPVDNPSVQDLKGATGAGKALDVVQNLKGAKGAGINLDMVQDLKGTTGAGKAADMVQELKGATGAGKAADMVQDLKGATGAEKAVDMVQDLKGATGAGKAVDMVQDLKEIKGAHHTLEMAQDLKDHAGGTFQKQTIVNMPQKLMEEKVNALGKSVGLKALFRYAKRKDVLLMLGGTLCGWVVGACLPILLIVFGDMVDIFTQSAGQWNQTELIASGCNWTQFGYSWEDIAPPDGNNEQFNEVLDDCGQLEDLNSKLLEEMSKFSVFYIVLACIVVLAAYGQKYLWSTAARRQSAEIRIALFRSTMRQDIEWFDTFETGQLSTRMSDDLLKIEDGLGEQTSHLFQGISTFLVCIIISFVYGWKLTLIALATTPLIMASALIVSKMSSLAKAGELSANAKGGAAAQQMMTSMKTIIAFGGEAKEAERYTEKLGESKKGILKKALYNGGALGGVYVTLYGVYALVLWYGAKLVRDDPDNYSAGAIIAVSMLVLRGAFALGSVTPSLENLGSARGAASFIYDLIDQKPKIDRNSDKGLKPTHFYGVLSIRNASFEYPGRPEFQAVSEISLEVKPGQTAALVGRSGSGKSTVLRLLQRFYDVNKGSIQLDGNNIKNYNIKWIRQHIGVVDQEPVLFDTTIKENIICGREGVKMTEVIKACKDIHAYEFIQKLPKKFDTLVGEGGTKLSVGQKQQIAIARVLIRNPKILLLDRITSALDSKCATAVLTALDKASHGKTVVTIPDKLYTARTADVIFVFKKGKIQEKGTHSELISRQGMYYKFYNSQNLEPPQPKKEPRNDSNNSSSKEQKGKDKATTQNLSGITESVLGQVSNILPNGEPLTMLDVNEKELLSEAKEEVQANIPGTTTVQNLKQLGKEKTSTLLGGANKQLQHTMPDVDSTSNLVAKGKEYANGLLGDAEGTLKGVTSGDNAVIDIETQGKQKTSELLEDAKRRAKYGVQETDFAEDLMTKINDRECTDSVDKMKDDLVRTGLDLNAQGKDILIKVTPRDVKLNQMTKTRDVMKDMKGGVTDAVKSQIGDFTKKGTAILKEKRSRGGNLMIRVLKLIAPEAFYFAVGCLVAVIVGAVQPSLAIIFGEITTIFDEPEEKQEEEAFLWSMMFLVIGAVSGVGVFLQSYTLEFSGEALAKRIRTRLFTAYLNQGVAFFEDSKNSTGTLCTQLAADATALQTATGARTGHVIMNTVAVVNGVIIGFIYSWQLAVVLVAFLLLTTVAGIVETKLIQRNNVETREANEKAGKILTEATSNMHTVASLANEDYFVAEYKKYISMPNEKAKKNLRVASLLASLSQAFIYFGYAAIFYLAAYLVEKDDLTFANMFKVFTAVLFGGMLVTQAIRYAPDYGKAKEAAVRIFTLLDSEPDSEPFLPTETQGPAKGAIHLKDVYFHYPTRPSIEVLKGLSLDIKPGQTVALVGPSGGGKSTILALLLKLYEVNKGSVCLDDNEVTSVDKKWLRAQMAIVQQEPVLFDTSIRENIAYGALDTPAVDDVIKAARDASIHEFISSLPGGYETTVGKKGLQLSGGQKQRVAIARALIRNPKILLLDEATSALDTKNERAILEALEKARQGRTTVAAVHKLSSAKYADCIFVIENGVVKEKGSHNELMKTKGAYFKLRTEEQQNSKT